MKTIKLQTIFVAGLLILGSGLTTWGVIDFLNYQAGIKPFQEHSSGIALGWSPSNSGETFVDINIDVYPNVNETGISYIDISLSVQSLVNGTFTFAFLSPFVIQNDSFRPSTNVGQWQEQNIDHNGSVIWFSYFSQTDPQSHESIANSYVSFSFTGLPYQFDHGTTTIVFPLNEGYPIAQANFMQQHQIDVQTMNSAPLHLNVAVDARDSILNSFPGFIGESSNFNGFGQAEKSLNYNITEQNDLTIEYQNPDSANNYSLEQAFSLFLLGLGIPTIIGILLEIVRIASRKKHLVESVCSNNLSKP